MFGLFCVAFQTILSGESNDDTHEYRLLYEIKAKCAALSDYN